MPQPSRGAPPTVEEGRLEAALVPGGAPVAQQLLAASGLDALVTGFTRELRAATSLAQAGDVVRQHGQRLWDTAVARAQGRVQLGSLDRYDDRPLYWARTSMTAAVRGLEAGYLTAGQHRYALLHLLDRASRGTARPLWPAAAGAPAGATRAMVSGFDPYSLDEDVRHSNPSGATALQLDGRTLDTASGPVTVRAVVLPVNYTDFDQGVVEDAFGPALLPGGDRADLIMTISMTARGRMDVEQWAAGARGGWPDNNRDQHFGPTSRAARWPQPAEPLEWIRTTLPHEEMVAAGTGPWPVVLHDGVGEWPAGTFPDPTALRWAPDPSPGSTAASGAGGDYLSNESMYRSNRLRLALGADDVPGGHLHISALEQLASPEALTDAAFEADRAAVVEQTVALVAAAGEAVRRRGAPQRQAGSRRA